MSKKLVSFRVTSESYEMMLYCMNYEKKRLEKLGEKFPDAIYRLPSEGEWASNILMNAICKRYMEYKQHEETV